MRPNKYLLLLLVPFLSTKVFGQIGYYKKVEQITISSITAKQLFQRLDSLKQTRRSTDSKVELTFDRDIDFGYTHQRLDVTLNGANFEIDMMVKNDTILIKKVRYGRSGFVDSVSESFNKKKAYLQIDTNNIAKFLTKRNKYYGSSKNINSLKTDLDLNLVYSSGCGDSNQKPQEWLYIEHLVKEKDITTLKNWLNSISCEQQAFAVSGFKLLEKSGYKTPFNITSIINHIEKRNSMLVRCEGCFILIR